MPELKIVILEDDRSTRGLITMILEKAGYQVLGAGEGRLAIELVMRERPDLLVADVFLPDMKGSDVVKQLKATAFGCELKTLFLTSLLSKNGAENVETKLTLDGKEFPALAKPFKVEVLLEIVKGLIGDPKELEAVQNEIEAAVFEMTQTADQAIDEATEEVASEETPSEEAPEKAPAE